MIVAVAVAALAVPAAAIASHGQSGESHGKAKGHTAHAVAYIFKGIYAGEGAVEVKSGNAHVRKGGLTEQTVTFDLTNARIVVADNDKDGEKTLDDVQTGDKVLVMARLPRKEPGSQPFVAKRLVDQTHPAETTATTATATS